MKNIWKELTKPIFVLAPMDDVTDVVFRQIVSSVAAPDLYFTEFTNVDGLASVGRDKLIRRLDIEPKTDHPIIAQLWGLDPKNYTDAAKLCKKLSFDGIDINMGCPVRTVTRNGACSALINNPNLAAEIIAAVKEGSDGLPISVKTRLGFSKIQTEEWIGFLLKQNLAALTVHGRIAREMSKFPANWEEIGKVIKLRDEISPNTIIIGNGDVCDYADGIKKVKKYKVDGIMIGRGIFHDITAFSKSAKELTVFERCDILIIHLNLFDETFGKLKPLKIMKKFIKIYISGFEGAAELRARLMELKTKSEIITEIQSYQKSILK